METFKSDVRWYNQLQEQLPTRQQRKILRTIKGRHCFRIALPAILYMLNIYIHIYIYIYIHIYYIYIYMYNFFNIYD